MQACDLQWLRTVLEVTIHERYGYEEGLIITVEVGQHLDDPVDHASTNWSRDLVPLQAIRGVKLKLLGPEVLLNVAAKLRPQVYVLSLNVRGQCPGHMSRWMALHYFVRLVAHLLDTWRDLGGLN